MTDHTHDTTPEPPVEVAAKPKPVLKFYRGFWRVYEGRNDYDQTTWWEVARFHGKGYAEQFHATLMRQYNLARCDEYKARMRQAEDTMMGVS